MGCLPPQDLYQRTGFTIFGRLVFFQTNEKDTENHATGSAGFLRIPLANQKPPIHASGTRPFWKKCRAAVVLAPPRDAISPTPREALQCRDAAPLPNVRAETARRKTPLPSADIPNPLEEPPARIGCSLSPW